MAGEGALPVIHLNNWPNLFRAREDSLKYALVVLDHIKDKPDIESIKLICQTNDYHLYDEIKVRFPKFIRCNDMNEIVEFFTEAAKYGSEEVLYRIFNEVRYDDWYYLQLNPALVAAKTKKIRDYIQSIIDDKHKTTCECCVC